MKKENISQRLFLLLVFFVSFIFLGLIKEFSLGIFWAVVLSILFSNSHSKIFNRMRKKPNLAAALTLSGILVVVILPLALLSVAVTNETIHLIEDLNKSKISLREIFGDLEHWASPYLRKIGFTYANIESIVSDFALDSSGLLGSKVLGYTSNIFNTLFQIAIMLYVLYFFLRDGNDIKKSIIKNFPLLNSIEYRLFNRFTNVTKATVKGSLLIAILQGVLGGILFSLIGVKGALVWGTLMILASLLPVGGIIVWGPIAAIYCYQGQYMQGVIIILVGSLLIGLLDNFLRPRLVGNDTKLPDYIILISTLGGISWFGLSGFVLGPVIAALFITCWKIVGETYGRDQKTI